MMIGTAEANQDNQTPHAWTGAAKLHFSVPSQPGSRIVQDIPGKKRRTDAQRAALDKCRAAKPHGGGRGAAVEARAAEGTPSAPSGRAPAANLCVTCAGRCPGDSTQHALCDKRHTERREAEAKVRCMFYNSREPPTVRVVHVMYGTTIALVCATCAPWVEGEHSSQGWGSVTAYSARTILDMLSCTRLYEAQQLCTC